MKPTKMRNNQIYRASYQTRSKQLGSPLSKELRQKYGKRSIRVIEGDTVKVFRGEYKDVDGKVSEVSTHSSSVAIEGIKKEKGKGDKFDVLIHTSNVIVTSLNTDDSWRMAKLEGKNPKSVPKTPKPVKKKEAETSKEKSEDKPAKKEVKEEKESEKKNTKELKKETKEDEE
ncbi:MAG: 50S ribosomal protein L24 [Nitrosopumilaceae archaeon]